jgi:hypothetical protein
LADALFAQKIKVGAFSQLAPNVANDEVAHLVERVLVYDVNGSRELLEVACKRPRSLNHPILSLSSIG